MLVCISAIAVWEGLRPLVRWLFGRSRSERRLARLERLQRMAARATQAEINRLEREAGSELGHGSGSDPMDENQTILLHRRRPGSKQLSQGLL